jgi:hypothetical protein
VLADGLRALRFTTLGTIGAFYYGAVDRFVREAARLSREAKVSGWSGPSTRSRSARTCSNNGIALTIRSARM